LYRDEIGSRIVAAVGGPDPARCSMSSPGLRPTTPR
jgi:hypothetical protein